MEMVENLVKTTVQEIEKVLNTRTVFGEPVIVGETTLIPLISVGFCFGSGGGEGKAESKEKGEGSGGGAGGGAWVRPKAVIIIDKSGVRIEPIMGSFGHLVEKMSETLPRMVEKCAEKRQEQKKEG